MPDLDAPDCHAIIAGKLIRPDQGLAEEDQILIVEKGRITAVQPHDGNIGSGHNVIDLSAFAVLPGLIDCHTHLTIPHSFHDLVDELKRSPAQCAFESIPNARAKLLSGFTTVREAGSYWALVDVALRDAIGNGTVQGPAMLVPGAMITMTGGAGALTGISHEVELPRTLRFGQANSPAELRERVREVISRGADVIKVFASGAVMQHGCCSPSSCEFTVEELRSVVEEANQFERKVMAHAHSAQGIKNAVTAGVASIEHGTMLDEEGAEMMKERGTFLVPTLSVWDSFGPDSNRPQEFLLKAREVADHHDTAFQTALRVGVKIALGSDSVVCPHDQGARELHHMVRLGMPPMAALKAATSDAAQLLDIADVGVIGEGQRADLIAVGPDVLTNIDAAMDVTFVMQSGRIIKALPSDSPKQH